MKRLLTVNEAALLLNGKESWLRSLIFKKKIPYIKLGSLIRFDLQEIEEWVRQNKVRDDIKSGQGPP